MLVAPMSATAQSLIDAKSNVEPITPIPLTLGVNVEQAALGRDLFMDVRLSADDTVACVSCHPLDAGGVDGLPFSVGVQGAVGRINAPTVYNSGFNFVQFWDGRAETLEEQIVGPVHNPIEMASSWDEVIGKLSADASIKGRFAALYPDGLTAENIQNAIAEFERSLFTPNSPFDRYLRGESDAISTEAKQGYLLFKAYGCSACHQGVNVGGNMYEKLGVVHDYFSDRGGVTEADYGRFNATGKAEHKFEFKVPSLRNVALTAPYFHDGSAETLDQAVKTMAWYQLGRRMPEDNLYKIVAFLVSLTGEHEEMNP